MEECSKEWSVYRVGRVLWYALVFLLPLQTVYIISHHTLGGGQSQYTILAWYVTDILLVGVLCCAFIVSWRERFVHIGPLHYLLAGLVVVAGFSLWTSPDVMLSLQAWLRLAVGALLVIFLPILRINIVTTAKILVVSGGIQSLLGITQVVNQYVASSVILGVSEHAPWILGDSVIEREGSRFLRAYGLFPHPNILGAWLGMSLIASVVLAFMEKKGKYLVLFLFASSLLLAGLILTFSRESYIATLIGLFVVVGLSLWHHGLKRAVRVRLGCISLILCVVAFIVSLLVWQPLSTRLGFGGWGRLESKSINERTHSFQDGLSLVLQHPILGLGIGASVPARYLAEEKRGIAREAVAYQPVHMVWLLVANETGIGGLLLFLFFMVLLFKQGVQGALGDWRLHHLFTLPLLVFLFVMSLFDHFFWSIHAGILMWGVVTALSYSEVIHSEKKRIIGA